MLTPEELVAEENDRFRMYIDKSFKQAIENGDLTSRGGRVELSHDQQS